MSRLRYGPLQTATLLLLLGSATAAQEVRDESHVDRPCAGLSAPAELDPERSWLMPRPAPAPDSGCLRAVRIRSLPVEGRLVFRTGIPDPREAGVGLPLAGTSAHLRAGADVTIGRLTFRIAPEFALAQNADFFTFTAADVFVEGFNPPFDRSRSDFASPWYHGHVSADLPSRPGNQPFGRLHLGESAAALRVGPLTMAVTSALPQWGPDVGEGLVLGRSAPGFPRWEARLDQSSTAGQSSLRWFSGVVLESRFFDQDASNNQRGLAGLRLEHRVAGLSLGASRTVMGTGRLGRMERAAGLPFTRAHATDSVIDLLSLDARFVTAATGGVVWTEVTRQTPLRSGQDLLRLPTEGIALRFGFEQRLMGTERAEWRLGTEFVRLDQPAQRVGRHPADFYTSAAVIQGWTHLGHPLGSGLGPGGQRQLVSVERRSHALRVRVFGERARWNDDALYRQYLPNWYRHDVSYQLGLRAAIETAGAEQALSLRWGRRTNYLFQNDFYNPGYRLHDVTAWQVALTLSPTTPRPR